MKFKFKVQRYQNRRRRCGDLGLRGQLNQGASVYPCAIWAASPSVRRARSTSATRAPRGYANAPVALSALTYWQTCERCSDATRSPSRRELFCSMGACQLDVEMETGTGKTYVYTKTMLELNRLYGWCKFIVVVPSVAIREGVAKSLENTQGHFFSQYHKKIRFFTYDSDNLTELDAYSQSSDVNCMVINMQAFNAIDEGGRQEQGGRASSSTSATSSAAVGPSTS